MNVRLLIAVSTMLVVFAGCQGITGGVSPAETATETGTPAPETTTPTETVPEVTERDRSIWSLSLTHINAEPKPGREFDSYVATGGRHSGQIYGVAVQFIAENGTVISEVPVGNITELGKPHWANTTVPTVPVYVVPKVDG